MRVRACLSLTVIAAVTACASIADGPTGPANLARAVEEDPGAGPIGEPPPPRLDTGETNIDVGNELDLHRVAGLYFANKQGTNAWISFVSNGQYIATPNARLQYNEKNGKTNGTGLLSFSDGSSLDLSRVRITEGSFGSCPTPSPTPTDVASVATCGAATYTFGSGGTSALRVAPRAKAVITPGQ